MFLCLDVCLCKSLLSMIIMRAPLDLRIFVDLGVQLWSNNRVYSTAAQRHFRAPILPLSSTIYSEPQAPHLVLQVNLNNVQDHVRHWTAREYFPNADGPHQHQAPSQRSTNGPLPSRQEARCPHYPFPGYPPQGRRSASPFSAALLLL